MRKVLRAIAALAGSVTLLAATPAFAHDWDHHGWGEERFWHERGVERGYERGYERGWHDREGGRAYVRVEDRVRYLPPPPPPRFEERWHHRDRWVGVPVVEAVPVVQPVYPRAAVTISLPSIVIPLH